MKNSYQSGRVAEAIALDYLLSQGLVLIQKNFYSRFGEIDLVMSDNNTIVFVEVRKRNLKVDDAIDSISVTKQRKLYKSAQYFLVKVGYEIACRFDLIAIDGHNNLQWLKNVIF